MIRLENWFCTGDPSPYLAPELRKLRLAGKVYGHPRFKDGSKVTTSSVVKVEGKKIITRSGSEYLLGAVDKEYREYLAIERSDWDEENPITVKKPQTGQGSGERQP